jgi:rubrerythrin
MSIVHRVSRRTTMNEQIPPEEEENRLFLVFRQAIEDERRAQETYREAMTITEDPILVAVFKLLYAEEVGHERKLMKTYNEFKKRYLGSPQK